MATAQGKQGIWMFIFSDRENTGNLPNNIKNMILRREFTSNTGKILKLNQGCCECSYNPMAIGKFAKFGLVDNPIFVTGPIAFVIVL